MSTDTEGLEDTTNNDFFVRPRISVKGTMEATTKSSIHFEDGILVHKRSGQQVVVNTSLPKAEWYELVEIAQSPENSDELWIAIGGKELHCSLDAGKTFTRVQNVAFAADLSFVPTLHPEKSYALFMFGTLKNGLSGGFISVDMGANWKQYDPEQFLPFA